MNVDRWVFLFAGAMVLAGVVLSAWVSPWWLLLPGFVGLNMLQASVTGFCPLARLLFKLGIRPGAAFQCRVKDGGKPVGPSSDGA